MKNPVKVVFFMGFAIEKDGFRGTNGPEIRFREMAKTIDAQILPIVIYPEFGNLYDDFCELEIQNRIKLVGYRPTSKLSYVQVLYKVLKTESPDVIHCQGPHLFDAIATFWGKYFKVKTIVTRPVNISCDFISKKKKQLFYILDQLITSKADVLVGISRTHKKEWLAELGVKGKSLSDKVKVVYNGVDLTRFRVEKKVYNENVIRIAVVAQLTDMKGHKVLLEAISRLKDNRNFHLEIVGDGPLRKELQQFCAVNGLMGLVSFKGQVNDVQRILAETDILVLPSFREGLPVSLIEGMAMGCCLIATDVGATSELVQDGLNGFLIPKENCEVLYERLKYLLNSKKNIRKMGQESLKLSKNYNLLNMTKKYAELYKTLGKNTNLRRQR